jgi:hypothetical protein
MYIYKPINVLYVCRNGNDAVYLNRITINGLKKPFFTRKMRISQKSKRKGIIFKMIKNTYMHLLMSYVSVERRDL